MKNEYEAEHKNIHVSNIDIMPAIKKINHPLSVVNFSDPFFPLFYLEAFSPRAPKL